MAISFVAAASGIGDGTSSVEVNKPTGTLEGHVMVAFIGGDAASVSNNLDILVPAGWTLIERTPGWQVGTNPVTQFAAMYKVAGASEGSSYTFLAGPHDTYDDLRGTILTFSGVSQSTPVNVSDWDTDSASGDHITPAPSVTTTEANCQLVCGYWTSNAVLAWTPTASMTERSDSGGIMVADEPRPTAGATGTRTATDNGGGGGPSRETAITVALTLFVPTAHAGTASLQAVATMPASTATHYKHGVADLQAVATMAAAGSVAGRAEVTMQAASRFIIDAPAISNDPDIDFTKYDAYIDTTGVVYHEGDTQAVTETHELTPTRSDVGANPDEIRPESGDIFGMSDFSGGGGQEFYHRQNRNSAAFYASEGFDISRPGQLKHLWDTAKANTVTTSVGALAQVQDLPFVADGTGIKRGDGTFPGVWTTEDPHNGEAATTVLDLTASGNELYAALGTNGVHKRDGAGAYDHLQPDGSTDLDVGTATHVAWAKDRLMVLGTGGTQVFEVTNDSTPPALKTFPTGWVGTDIFETGQFVYVPAINTNSGQARIHIFGLASSGATMEDRGSTPLPDGQLCYSGTGYLDTVFLGCGKRNADGGYDPLIYQALPSDSGHLILQKLAEEEGAGATNLSVGAVAPLGESVLFGWTQTSGASSGESREGLAIFHLGRAAFANHIRKATPAGTPQRVIAITVYKGRILFSLEGDGLYYEDLDAYTADAYLISSVADYFNAGSKTWSYLEQAYKPLPSGTSVSLDFTTKHPEDDTWAEALNDSIASSESAETSLSRTESRIFAIRLNSNATANQLDAPTILSFAVRSDPLPLAAEFNLVRYIRINEKDKKWSKGEPFSQEPKLVRKNIQALAWRHVTFYEADATWNARVVGVADYEPVQPHHEVTSGETPKESYVLRLTMRGTRDA